MNTSNLRELVHDQGVEGVYCSTRETLVDTVVGLFEVLVKKVLDIDHMRGIVMGATAEIDLVVQDCLLAIHKSCDPEGQMTFMQQARKRLIDNAVAIQKEADSALMKEEACELLSDRILTADHKLRFLIRRLKQFENLRSLCERVVEYQNKIIPMRNQLAHARLLRNGDTVTFEGADGSPITVEQMREVRCNLLDYRGIFKELLGSLSNSGKPSEVHVFSN